MSKKRANGEGNIRREAFYVFWKAGRRGLPSSPAPAA